YSIPRPHQPHTTLFPYTTLFRSTADDRGRSVGRDRESRELPVAGEPDVPCRAAVVAHQEVPGRLVGADIDAIGDRRIDRREVRRDRKSTRLNSSHRTISYAVFCL